MLIRRSVRTIAVATLHLLSPAETTMSTSPTTTCPPSVYFGVMKVPFANEATRDECLKGFEATMGKYYRNYQPGYIAYLFGACRQEPSCLLGFHVWSSKELFDALPQSADDAEKLSACRLPFMEKIIGAPMPFLAKHSVGDVSGLPTPADLAVAAPLFDEIMGVNFDPDLPAVERNNLYFIMQQITTTPGMAAEYAAHVDAITGDHYRSHPDCLLCLTGVGMEDNTILFCSLWKSKESCEVAKQGLPAQQQEEASMIIAVDDNGKQMVDDFDTSYMVGPTNAFEYH